MTAEEYLNQIPMWTRKKNSLVQIRRFLEEMGNPDRSLSVIHVAGTNGKGSVCAYLTSALCEAGYQVGTFTSPHLVDIRERFLLNGVKVEEEEFVRSFKRVKDTWLVPVSYTHLDVYKRQRDGRKMLDKPKKSHYDYVISSTPCQAEEG